MTSANSNRRAAPIDSPDAGRAMSLGRLAVPHLDAAETRITESEPDAKQPDHTAPAHRVASNFPSDFSRVASCSHLCFHLGRVQASSFWLFSLLCFDHHPSQTTLQSKHRRVLRGLWPSQRKELLPHEPRARSPTTSAGTLQPDRGLAAAAATDSRLQRSAGPGNSNTIATAEVPGSVPVFQHRVAQ